MVIVSNTMKGIKKIGYKYQVLIYFSLLIAAVSLAFAFMYTHRERVVKMEVLKSSMAPYADLIYSSLSADSLSLDKEAVSDAMERLLPVVPSSFRVTVLSEDAWVLFDNSADKDIVTDNHLNRPELAQARREGTGSEIRFSKTLKREYLYLAKHYPGMYVRIALEYSESVLPVVIVENRYMVFILMVFAGVIAALVIIIRRISRPVKALKEFVGVVKDGGDDFNGIRFTDDELGEVGEKIMTAFRQLEETKRYKQELTHNVAHELKTPVAGIMGYLETLLQQENIEKEQSRFFLERAYAQTIRLSAIINDISILNKIEEAPDKFGIETINIHNCIDEIRSDLSFRLEEKRIEFHNMVDEKLEIQGSYILIYSLFKNLIDNSVDHAGDGVKIFIENTSALSGFAGFRYYDTGKGVAEEHRVRIFERFYRVEKGRSRKSGGSGLGLSIVKNAVTLHKGTIKAGNHPNGGLQFEFTLGLNLKS